MDKLWIALAGVVVGALVSEGLRYWRGLLDEERRFQATLRLVRHEIAIATAVLDNPGVTADDIRGRIRRKTLVYRQWEANERALAEWLSADEWATLSGAYLGLQLLLSAAEEEEDEDLLSSAQAALKYVEKASGVLWPTDQRPPSTRRARLRRRE